jgi:hypothetical protein
MMQTFPETDEIPYNNEYSTDPIPRIPEMFNINREEDYDDPPPHPEEAKPNQFNSNSETNPKNADRYTPRQHNHIPYVSQQPMYDPNVQPYPTAYIIPLVNDVPPPPVNYIPYVVQQPMYDANIPPYPTPYLVPLTNTYPQSGSDFRGPHQQDADLSRLEVYHFTPKQKPPIGIGGQPIFPYYNYPYPAIPPPQQRRYPSPWHVYPPYTHRFYDYPPYGNNVPESYQSFLPPIKTRARSSQTDKPRTNNRAISPMHEHSTAFDANGYPYIHQRILLTDRYHGTLRKSDQEFRHSIYSTPLPDCRCLHCQRERAKVLNYYSD